MAAQHTLNASPMHACRSSDVSATAAGHKNATREKAAIGKNILIELPVCSLYLPGIHTCIDLSDLSFRQGMEIFTVAINTKRSQPLQVWLSA
ncbi:MAG: hypothetical protein WBG10_10190 [Pseudolabrys sp.]|jgi:hypothetical protein